VANISKLKKDIEKELGRLDYLGDPRSRASDSSTESYYSRYQLQHAMQRIAEDIRSILRRVK
jgi:hypothetical protein